MFLVITTDYRDLRTGMIRWLAAILCGVGMLCAPTGSWADVVTLSDLENRPINPLQIRSSTTAVVFLFVSTECPVSNRYAPEIQRLSETFGARGVQFWLVYANRADSRDIIRTHIREFSYSIPALRDPEHQLVKLAKAIVTPEVAVFDVRRRLVYHGRIDDRYAQLGVERPVATRHDLEDALNSVLAGRPTPRAYAPPVGCFISDFN